MTAVHNSRWALRTAALALGWMLTWGHGQWACAEETKASAAVAITTQSGKQVSAEQLRDATLFWRNFRQALLQGQKDKLAGMVRMPLVVKGVTDDQTPRRVGKAQLVATLNTLLAQEIYPVNDAGHLPKTLRKVVETTPELQAMHWASPKQLRVESLAFAKDKSGWKLVTVYDEAQ